MALVVNIYLEKILSLKPQKCFVQGTVKMKTNCGGACDSGLILLTSPTLPSFMACLSCGHCYSRGDYGNLAAVEYEHGNTSGWGDNTDNHVHAPAELHYNCGDANGDDRNASGEENADNDEDEDEDEGGGYDTDEDEDENEDDDNHDDDGGEVEDDGNVEDSAQQGDDVHEVDNEDNDNGADDEDGNGGTDDEDGNSDVDNDDDSDGNGGVATELCTDCLCGSGDCDGYYCRL
ncbi:hypothetical protein OROMI_013185 [Orobanche minor]